MGGVLFLDELAEFRKPVLEVLRQPLEEHKIRISRNSGCYEYPADFMLIAAMNPCPCGNYPDLNKCNCTKTQIQNYLGHVSQPFLDRMDLCVEASRVEYGELHKTGKEETSAEIRNRVCTARKIQEQRYEGTDIRTNSGIGVLADGRILPNWRKRRKTDAMCIFNDESDCPDLIIKY